MGTDFLVSFEGVEGSGKSTQARLLKQRLEGAGAPVLLTCEPGGTPAGNALRDLLLKGERLEPLTELLLFLADRRQHWREVIQPALAEGKVVIVDRFLDSTVAYQGYGRGLPIDEINHLNHWVLDGEEPDVTALMDLPLQDGMQRLAGEKDKIESEEEAFHLRIREGYLAEARKYPERIVVFDGLLSVEELSEKIFAEVGERYRARAVKAR